MNVSIHIFKNLIIIRALVFKRINSLNRLGKIKALRFLYFILTNVEMDTIVYNNFN